MTAAASERLPVLLSPGPADGAGSWGGRFAAPITYAVFGQGTYKFADNWQLLLGGRENRDGGRKTETG